MSPVGRPPSVIDKFLAPLISTMMILTIPVVGYQDIVPRVLIFICGAGSIAAWKAYRSAVRFYRMRQLPWDLTPRCGVPLMVGGFCEEPASPGCCYCDIHADWPESDRNLNSPSLTRGL